MGKRAAGRQDVFAEAVAIIRSEDEELRRGLQKAEAVVESSTQRMQADLNTLTVRTQDVGIQALNAGQLFAGFGAQVSAVGGKVGMAGGKIASLGGALSALGPALLGPAGAILAITASLGLLIQHFVSTKDKAAAAREELQKLREERSKLYGAEAKAWRTTTERRLLMLAEAEGPEAALYWKQHIEQQKLFAREEEIKATLKAGFPEGKIDLAEWAEYRQQLTEELETIGQIRKLVTEKWERDLAALRKTQRDKEDAEQKIAHERQLAEERKWLADMIALHARRMERFKATPEGTVAFGIQGAYREEQRMREVMGQFMIQMMALGPAGMPGMGLFGPVAAKLGLSFAGGGMGGAGAMGSVPLRAFAASGAGGPADVLDKRREQLEKQRTDYAARTAKATETIARREPSGVGP